MCKGPEAGACLASVFWVFFFDHLLEELAHALFFPIPSTSLASPGIYVILF